MISYNVSIKSHHHRIVSFASGLILLLIFCVSNGVCSNESPESSLSPISDIKDRIKYHSSSSPESTSISPPPPTTKLPTLDTASIPSGEQIPPEPQNPTITLPLLPPPLEEKAEKQTKARPGGSLQATTKNQTTTTDTVAPTNNFPFDATALKENVIKFGSIVLDLLKTQLTTTLNGVSGATGGRLPPGKKSTIDEDAETSRRDRKIGDDEKLDKSDIDWLGFVMNGSKGLGEFFRDLQVESLYETVFLFFKWLSLYYVGFLIP